MLQLSVSEFSTYRWSFFQDVIRYSSNGYSSIGVWRTKVEDYGLVEAIDLLPTFCKLANIEATQSLPADGGADLDGQDMSAAVLGGRPRERPQRRRTRRPA